MRRGQHFLVDDRVAERQVAYAALSRDDVVLEIGAGNGALTRHLAEVAGRVIAIEIDAELAVGLENMENVELVRRDALEVDFSALHFNKVVANLPYQISSPVTFKLLEHSFDLGVLMYQKEFAERLVAAPGSDAYARLSVMAQYAADWELLETVSPGAFYPRPKIRSAIVRMTPRPPLFSVVDEAVFAEVVRALFSHRRKKIRNGLLAAGLIGREQLEAVPYVDRRAEDLLPAQIGAISDAVAVLQGER
ncbi:MAG: 16S rRNA (adenine(1518)-N(6)/adenine(1519)-N(6))-dimethyltransferase RsmA [Thermoplasmatota archaeon]